MRIVLLGWPLGHSVSPAMHNAAFAEMGLGGWTYEAVPVSPGFFDDKVQELLDAGVSGLQVTVPHKEAVLKHCTAQSAEVESLGAANTLVLVDGQVRAHNTDLPGFVRAWDVAFGQGSLRSARAVVVGAGGAARAVVAALSLGGADQLVLLNRSVERAQALLDDTASLRLASGLQATAEELSDVSFATAVASADAVIQTTSVGMSPHNRALPVHWPTSIPEGLRVLDVIYNPRPTRFLEEAAAKGARTCDGLPMLVEQGALAFELWTGLPAPRGVMTEAASAALAG